MPSHSPSVFALPDRLAHKADPNLIARDEQHFARISRALEETIADLTVRLTARRRDPAGRGAQTIERDADIRRMVAELATLRRFGLDVCIGHTYAAGGERVYVGRIGLIDAAGTVLLVDWRTPAAEPFFAATLADPRGVLYRRRYRWSGGRIVDFWDEVLDDDYDDEVARHVSLDDQSAFASSLSGARTGRMRDVLSTIQADQDEIIRADSRGALVVDGGPGTGKTVVALHRAAYLLHEQSRSGLSRGNLLLVGPHRPYLDYVADVLPALGEHSVQTATVADLAEGSGFSALGDEVSPEVARLKSEAAMVDTIETAVRFYEQPPEESMLVQTDWVDVRLTGADWAEAFSSVEDGTPHNEAHVQIRETLTEILLDKALSRGGPDTGASAVDAIAGGPSGNVDEAVALQSQLASSPEVQRALLRAWPMIRAEDLMGDLWTVPAYLRLCAPWLSGEQVQLLRRATPDAWTTADLPLLDAARQRLGDADRARRSARRGAERRAELERRKTVIDEVIEADDDPEGVSAMLRHADLQEALLDPSLDPSVDEEPGAGSPRFSGPFGHIIVDEAQELTDAQWRMILRRCPSGSLTVVGDRAQSRGEFDESWAERLARIGLSPERISKVELTINYRTPSEIMDAAAPVIRAVRPNANVPESVRSSGVPVEYGKTEDLGRVLHDWLGAHPEGVACVISALGDALPSLGVLASQSGNDSAGRVRALTPADAKGLEFDLVVLVDPGSFGSSPLTTAVDQYVAMTRATQALVVLS